MVDELLTTKHWSVPENLTGNFFIFGRIGCLDENTEIVICENEKLVVKKIKNLPEEFFVESFDFINNVIKIEKSIKIKSNITTGYNILFDNGSSVIASENPG